MMSSVNEEFNSILSGFNLREVDCRKPVTYIFLDEISLKCCGEWKFLSSQLELEDNVVGDIDRKPIEEKEKRREFFREWKQRKGSEANYERLILALLKCKRRQDADNVCELLSESLQASCTSAPVTCDCTHLQDPSSVPAATTHMPVTSARICRREHTPPQQTSSTAQATTLSAPRRRRRREHTHNPPLFTAPATTSSDHTPPQQTSSTTPATTLSASRHRCRHEHTPSQPPSTAPVTTSSDHTPPQQPPSTAPVTTPPTPTCEYTHHSIALTPTQAIALTLTLINPSP